MAGPKLERTQSGFGAQNALKGGNDKDLSYGRGSENSDKGMNPKSCVREAGVHSDTTVVRE